MSRHRRPLFQFSARALLLSIGLFCLFVACITNAVKNEEAAIRLLRSKGCSVTRAWSFDQTDSQISLMVKNGFGSECANRSISIISQDGQATGPDWLTLRSIPYLQLLLVSDSNLTDADMSVIAERRSLVLLHIRGPNSISDRSIVYFARHTKLTTLALLDCNITDNSIDAILSIESLEWVALSGTRISKKGVARLRARRPLLEVVK